jgi:ketosteroid isomerase-like protein
LAPGRYQLTTTAPLTYNGQAYGWSIELPLTAPVNYVRLSQENAVRLAPQNGIEPALREATLAQGTAGSKPGGDEAEARAQINALLNRWVASVKSRSLQTQMSCYAPQLTSYLQQGSLSRAQLEARKQKMLTAYTSTHLDLSNIELSIHGSQAVANAIKSWDFSNNEVDSRGRTLLSLGLAKLDGRWLIISEQEYAVPAPSRNAPPRLAASTSAGAR